MVRSGLLAACFVAASVLAGQAQRGNRLGVATIDSEAAARGAPLYASNCAFCHGADARGAQAPDLAQSLYIQSDDGGLSFAEFMRVGRTVNGMPAFPQMSAANLSDLTAFLKSKIAEGRGRGGFDPASIVVGNAQRGEAYFNGVGQCRTCHSPAGDLKGVGAKSLRRHPPGANGEPANRGRGPRRGRSSAAAPVGAGNSSERTRRVR